MENIYKRGVSPAEQRTGMSLMVTQNSSLNSLYELVPRIIKIKPAKDSN